MTGQGQGKTITRSAELECSRLKMSQKFSFNTEKKMGKKREENCIAAISSSHHKQKCES
jgi:hypothetical protein